MFVPHAVMANEANPPIPFALWSRSRRDYGNKPSRHEGGRRSSRQLVQGRISHTDSMRNPSVSSGNPSVSSGAKAGGTAENLGEEGEEYFSPYERELLQRSHQPQTKSVDVTAMVAVVVVRGIVAGRSLPLGKEQPAKSFPPNPSSVPPTNPSSVIATS